jgi:hypothetical protein
MTFGTVIQRIRDRVIDHWKGSGFHGFRGDLFKETSCYVKQQVTQQMENHLWRPETGHTSAYARIHQLEPVEWGIRHFKKCRVEFEIYCFSQLLKK